MKNEVVTNNCIISKRLTNFRFREKKYESSFCIFYDGEKSNVLFVITAASQITLLSALLKLQRGKKMQNGSD